MGDRREDRAADKDLATRVALARRHGGTGHEPTPLGPQAGQGLVDGGYSSVSEYVRDLVREDQKRQTQENLEALLLEATRSGPGREFTKADWEGLRRELTRRLAKRSAK